MSKIILPSITNGQDLSTLNSNFQLIASQLNTNVLYRKNIAGEDNTIQNDLDFNGFRAYNLLDVLVNGVSILTVTTNAQNAATAASNSAAAALASQISAASSQSAAAQSAIDAASAAGQAGSLIAVNNLSDVPNKTTARTNLQLGNVNNTSDLSKPISTATQSALDLKAPLNSPVFVSPTTGTTPVAGDASGAMPNTLWVNAYFLKTTVAASTYAPIASPTFTGTVSGITATMVGLGNVNNTADSAKPVSTAQATAIALKLNHAGDTTGGNAVAGDIGEYQTGSGGPSGVVSASTTSVGAITLPAGDWDVQSTITFSCTAASIGAVLSGVSKVINTFNEGIGSYQQIPTPPVQGLTVCSPVVRYNLSASTTIYPTGNVSFSSGTCTMQTIIRARRIR